MKVQTHELKSALWFLSSIPEKKNERNLNCVQISSGNGLLTITALSSSSSSAHVTIEASDTPVNGLFDYSKLSAFVSAAKGDTINVIIKNGKARLSSGRSKISMPVLQGKFQSETGFPDEYCKIGSGDLLSSLIAVSYASSYDNPSRPFANGVFIDTSKANSYAVATDGHRLAASKIPIKGIKSSLIPKKSVDKICSVVSKMPHEQEVKISAKDGVFYMQVGGFSYETALIEVNYPDWSRVVPKIENYFNISKEDIKEAISICNIASGHGKDRVKKIMINVKDESLELTAVNMADSLSREYDGGFEIEAKGCEDIEIIINSKYLSDAIDACNLDDIIIYSDSKVVMISHESQRHVIMMIRN